MPAYDPFQDKTLTQWQSANACFSNAVLSGIGDIRARSNPTLASHNSGYHESVIPTDGIKLLHDSTPSAVPGMETLAVPNSAGSAFAPHAGTNFYSQNKQTILEIADGFRTDTARTILSASNGRAAGHTGSGMSLTNQSDAHDLLRQSTIAVLFSNPSTTKGLTKQSIACVFGAITIASMAPGELARTVSGTLKDGGAANNWEARRNEAKQRLDMSMAMLTPQEEGFVIHHAGHFMTSTLATGHLPVRYLAPGRARSEDRDDAAPTGMGLGTITGGGYSTTTAHTSTVTPPANVDHWGYYFTEPFRAQRRP